MRQRLWGVIGNGFFDGQAQGPVPAMYGWARSNQNNEGFNGEAAVNPPSTT